MKLFLRGERVNLALPDKESFFNVLSKLDLESQQWLGRGGKFIPLDEIIEEHYKKVLEGFKNKTFFLFIIEHEGKTIGTVSINIEGEGDDMGRIGIYLVREYRGKGFGSEAIKLILFYSFELLGLRKIVSEVLEYNMASIRMHEKVGFVKTGVKRKEIYRFGKYWDVMCYEMLREEFEEKYRDWIEKIRKLNNLYSFVK